jgi:hypothetical protein
MSDEVAKLRSEREHLNTWKMAGLSNQDKERLAWLDGYFAAHDEKQKDMTLLEFIEDIESRFFRSNSDTGANSNALFIWNMVREKADLPKLTHEDLRQRQVDTSPDPSLTVENLEEFEAWYKEYSVYRDYPIMKRQWDELQAKGGAAYLFPQKENTDDT